MTRSTEQMLDMYAGKHFSRVLIAWSIVVGFYLINLSGVIYEPLEEITARITNRDYNGEGFIELIEAVCWVSAFAIYFYLLVKSAKLKMSKHLIYWLIFLSVFCFVAFGEEISWGQHIFGFDAPDTVKAINKQEELNIHNLNLSEIFGLEDENLIYDILNNFTHVLNPVFYLICSLMWFVIPTLRRIGFFPTRRIIQSMPMPVLATTVFCGANIFTYLIVDKLFFDVGEIFELSLSLVAILSALDAWSQRKRAIRQF